MLKELHLAINKSDNSSLNLAQKKIVQIIRQSEKSFYGKIGEFIHNDFESASNKINISDFLIKPISDSCNLRCKYCYEIGEHFKGSTKKMDLTVLEKTIKEILYENNSVAKFTWHGGEPLLLGLDYFKKIITYQKKWNKNKCKIVNMVQTNALLLDQSWYSFFDSNNFMVSISLDGIKSAHDKYRYDIKQRGTFDKILIKLSDLHIHKIPFHIISVINSEHENTAFEFYNNIKRNFIKSFDIHPNFKSPKHFIDPKKFSDFTIELFDLWLNDVDDDIDCLLFTDFISAFVSGKQSTCYFSGRCSEIAAIDGNGDIIPCTRPFEKNDFTFGNIIDDGLNELTSRKKFLNFLNGDQESINENSNCKWSTLCNNGCPQHRIIDSKSDIKGKSVFCNCDNKDIGGYFSIWEHIYETIQNLFKENRTANIM